ncbi:MAG: hypothetical protein ACJA2U_000182 [Marinomonas primoryensis]|jgi:hypothetical protein
MREVQRMDWNFIRLPYLMSDKGNVYRNSTPISKPTHSCSLNRIEMRKLVAI